MKIVAVALLIFLALVVQTRLSFFGVAPDITALLAYYFGVQGGATKGMAIGSLIGVLEDSLAGGILGPHLLGKGIVGYFSSSVSGGLFRWTPYLGMIAVFVLTMLDGVTVYLSRTLFETTPTSVSSAARIVLVQGLLNIVAGYFMRPRNAP